MENLIELKKIAKEIYEMYILLTNFLEKEDKESIFELSQKIYEYKLREEELLDSLDEKTFANLYSYALLKIEEDNPAYLDKLYFLIIDYYNTDYFYEGKGKVIWTRAFAFAYSYKKIFNIFQNDTLGLKNEDSKFFESMKHKLYPTFIADVMLCPEFEELVLSLKFDLNSLIYASTTEEDIINETISLISNVNAFNDIVLNEDNTLKILKYKYMFEYLVSKLDNEYILKIKDYLYSIKNDNFVITEFKKVIEGREKSYGR